MKRKLICILLAAVTAVGICGCSSVTEWIDAQKARLIRPEAQAGTQTETSEEQEEETPQKPNSISAGIYDFDTFNPLVTRSRSVKEAMELVYEPLYTLDGQMRPVPVLADSVEKSADGRTVTLNIKQGVTWHDGSMFTADDVAYTFQVIRSGITDYTQNLACVADVYAAGDHSVQITLNRSVPTFESLLIFPIIKLETDMSVDPGYIPNGTGPFCYGTKSSVDEIYFGAFENYRGGRAAIDAMYLQLAGTYDKYMSMLEASEIDFSSGDIVDLTKYMPKGSLQIYDYPENRMVFLGFNMANEMLSGGLTRKGISKLIDRGEIVDSVIFSRGTASEIPINPASYLYYGEGGEFEADVLSANSMLGDDGWGPNEDGLFVRNANGHTQRMSFELLTNADNSEQAEIAAAVAEQLGRLGLRIKITKLPYEQFMQRVTSGGYDMFIGEADIPANMDLAQLTQPGGNYFAYNNPELDTIGQQMGMVNSEEELKALFKQYSEIVLNDMPFAVIYYRKGSLISSRNVTEGVDPSYAWLYKNCSAWSTSR